MIIKVLSIRQPWAHAIIHLGKDIENRSKRTNYRGELYIHAALKAESHLTVYPDGRFVALEDLFFRGGLIGKVDLIDCVIKSESPWFAGMYGYVLANPRPLDVFVPLTGQLGIFNAEIPNGEIQT